MKLRFVRITVRLLSLLVVSSLAWPAGLAIAQDDEPPVSPDPLAPQAPLALEDNFGYTYEYLPDPLKIEDEGPYPFFDPYWPVNDMNPVSFENNPSLSEIINFTDLDTNDPVYEFRFYEQIMHGLQVSVNGLIRFIPGFDEDRFNFPLPTGDKSPVAPINFIAPLWGEFTRSVDPDTQIRYRFYNDDDTFLYLGHSALVIEWENLLHVDSGELSSFGVALLNNGDIYFLLKQLPSSLDEADFTIGINNSNGEDGLTYYHDGILAEDAFVENMRVVYFKVPPLNYRVKASPYLQGNFTENGKASFSISIHNITDLSEGDTSDTYNLTFEKDTTDPWGVEFYTANWTSKLLDTNGDTIPDTGGIAKGISKTVNLHVTAPPDANPGDTALITVKVESIDFITAVNEFKIQVSVPVAFLEIYQDASGGYGHQIWSLNQSTTYVFPDATNNNLGVGDYENGYVMASERPPVGGNSSIGYAFVDKLGFLRKGNSINNGGNNDHFPALGVHKSTGISGLAWVRNKTILFNIMDPNLLGLKFAIPKTVGSAAAHAAGYPAVAALADGSYLVAWPDGSAASQYKLKLAHLGGNGLIKGDITETVVYENVRGISLLPLPASWGANSVFLSYVAQSSGETQLYTTEVIFPGGTSPQVGALTAMPAAKVAPNSTSTSLALVNGDKVFLGWVDTEVIFTNKSNFLYYDQGIKYALIKSNGSVEQDSIMVPNWLQAMNVSVGSDMDGNGIIIWNDSQNSKYLYYALIDPTTIPVSELAPAMIHSIAPTGSIFTLSRHGQSVALFGGHFQTALPVIRK